MKGKELKENRKDEISGVILEKGTLQERSSPTAFFYFDEIKLQENSKIKNEEWKEISTNTIKQTIFLMNQNEEEEFFVIHIYYELQEFKEITKDYTIASQKRYAKQIDILVIGSEESISTTRRYKQEDYKRELIEVDLIQKAKTEREKENRREQKKFSREWGIFGNWMPKELLKLNSKESTFKMGEADLSVTARSKLISRKKVVKYSVKGIDITIYLPVKLYEIEVNLFRHQKEIMMTKKYILIL